MTRSLTIRGGGTGSGTVTVPAVGAQAAIICTITNGTAGAGCGGTYPKGTTVALTASPSAQFTGWGGGACPGPANPCSVVVAADTSIQANFAAPASGPATLVVAFTGLPAGVAPQGVLTGPNGRAGPNSFRRQLTGPATYNDVPPGQYMIFPGPVRSGPTTYVAQGSGTQGAGVAPGETLTLTVPYVATTNPVLTIESGGSALGEITIPATAGQPARNCLVSPVEVSVVACHWAYPAGTTLAVSATGFDGSEFAGWSGGNCPALTATCQITLTSSTTASPGFGTVRTDPLLTITGAGSGSGIVSAPGVGVEPPFYCVITNGTAATTSCAHRYPVGSALLFTATANGGSAFLAWTSGFCSGTTNPCVHTVTAPGAATVAFGTAGTDPTLSIAGLGSGNGTVTAPATAGKPTLNCVITAGVAAATGCTQSYPAGTAVSLTATATGGGTFGGWSGACGGTTNPCAQTVTVNTAVSATFAAAGVEPVLTITGAGTGSGTVTAPAAGGKPTLNCVITGGVANATGCAQAYPSGTAVALTATPATGSDFSAWNGGSCTAATNPCNQTVTVATAVTATFAGRLGTLNIVVAGLPAGVAAAGAITGPAGFTPQSLTGNATLAGISPGSYTITPAAVTNAGIAYAAPVVTGTVPPGGAATLTVTYAVASFAITTASLPSGSLNTPYPATVLETVGGTAPLTWSWAAAPASTIPAGLSLAPNTGTITGTPTAAGTFTVDVAVQDNANPKGSATRRFTIDISATPPQYQLVVLATGGTSIPLGATLRLGVRDAQGQPLAVTITGWTSSAPANLAVAVDGFATGLAVGASTVSATIAGAPVTQQFTVTGSSGGTLFNPRLVWHPYTTCDPLNSIIKHYPGCSPPAITVVGVGQGTLIQFSTGDFEIVNPVEPLLPGQLQLSANFAPCQGPNGCVFDDSPRVVALAGNRGTVCFRLSGGGNVLLPNQDYAWFSGHEWTMTYRGKLSQMSIGFSVAILVVDFDIPSDDICGPP